MNRGDHNKEGNVLFNDALNTFYLRLYCVGHMNRGDHNKEGNVLFNDALSTCVFGGYMQLDI